MYFSEFGSLFIICSNGCYVSGSSVINELEVFCRKDTQEAATKGKTRIF